MTFARSAPDFRPRTLYSLSISYACKQSSRVDDLICVGLGGKINMITKRGTQRAEHVSTLERRRVSVKW